MDRAIVMHEVATLLLGAGTCALIRAYLPLEDNVKGVALAAVVGLTVLRMAFVAGIL